MPKICKCEHWQQCPTCMPHRFDAEGELLPPELTPLQAARNEIVALKAQLDECKKEVDYKQSVIDNLMLEYCPNEMTERQLSTWEENQRAYQDDTSITKSAASARKD